MTKIVGDVRELTDNEVAIVAGGSLSGFIKDCLKAGLATVGGAAFGPAGAVVGFLVGAGNGQSVDDGAKVQCNFLVKRMDADYGQLLVEITLLYGASVRLAPLLDFICTLKLTLRRRTHAPERFQPRMRSP